MGSQVEMQRVIRQREEKIKELERLLQDKDDLIQELNSKLDKYQSVVHVPTTTSSLASIGYRRQGIAAESQTPKSLQDLNKDVFKVHTKPQSSQDFLKQGIMGNEFLKNLSAVNIRDIVDCMFPVEYKKDTIIIKEGDPGSRVYAIEDGKVEVTKEGQKLCNMGSGKVFGELAVLYNCARTATVRAVTLCKLWAIERNVFQGILIRAELMRLKENADLLKRVPRFQKETDDTVNKIAELLEERFYKNHEHIVQQGNRSESFYMITKGKAKETKRPTGSGEETMVRTLGRGDHFGEQALDSEETRSTTVTANDIQGVQCLVLDRKSLSALMSQPQINGKRTPNEDERAESKGDPFIEGLTIPDLKTVATVGVGGFSRVNLSSRTIRICVVANIGADFLGALGANAPREKVQWVPGTQKNLDPKFKFLHLSSNFTTPKSVLRDVSFEDLEVKTTVGVGGFGRVELVQLRNDSTKTFALKQMKKHHIVETRQQEHIMNEKNIMIEARCNFIVRLYKTFKDNKYLYMLLEPCLGGELWTLLRDKNCFDDGMARFYTGCVVEALAYLHSRGIVYRDLKPENLLLDEIGYIKIVDFGFAKKVGHGRKTWTFCGTPEYVPPEVILSRGHDTSSDLWSLGILIFELLTGSPPFSGVDPMKTYNLILKGIDAVDFPKIISRNAQLLIKKLCRDNPADRLGFGSNGIKDIKRHKWFEGLNWDEIFKRTLKAPYIPTVKNCFDTSNFDSYPAEEGGEPPDDLTGWDKDF